MHAEPLELFPCDPVLATDLHIRRTPSGHFILSYSFDDGTGPRLVTRIAVPASDIDRMRREAIEQLDALAGEVVPLKPHRGAPGGNRSG